MKSTSSLDMAKIYIVHVCDVAATFFFMIFFFLSFCVCFAKSFCFFLFFCVRTLIRCFDIFLLVAFVFLFSSNQCTYTRYAFLLHPAIHLFAKFISFYLIHTFFLFYLCVKLSRERFALIFFFPFYLFLLKTLFLLLSTSYFLLFCTYFFFAMLVVSLSSLLIFFFSFFFSIHFIRSFVGWLVHFHKRVFLSQ